MQTLGLGFTWEQLSAGQKFRTLNRTVTEADLMMFVGVTGMVEVIFTDHTFGAEKGTIQGRFVPAALTYSLIEGLLCQSMIQGTGLAMLELNKKVLAPVRVGDTIHAEVEVTSVRPTSKGNRGIVASKIDIKNQNGEVVITYEATRMLAGKVEVSEATMRGLKDKTVLLTGGANGIGAAIAQASGRGGLRRRHPRPGWRGSGEGRGRDQGSGGKASAHAVDISDYDAVKRAVEAFEAASRAGRRSWSTTPAGTAPRISSTPIRSSGKKSSPSISTARCNVSHVVMKGMAARGFGRVVNIASDAGRVGSSGEAVYSACKGGMIAFSKTMSRELVSKGIIINTLCPGPTDTAILRSFLEGPDGAKIAEGLKRAIPMRRLGQPDDYPGLVAFFLSDDAAYITGQTISVSGGLTMHG